MSHYETYASTDVDGPPYDADPNNIYTEEEMSELYANMEEKQEEGEQE